MLRAMTINYFNVIVIKRQLTTKCIMRQDKFKSHFKYKFSKIFDFSGASAETIKDIKKHIDPSMRVVGRGGLERSIHSVKTSDNYKEIISKLRRHQKTG
ncbi:MAG: hypothetical protein DWP95_07955 [Proteobacteria bacterium]|nr:MAG: hypothetical protein DWP95_07955 [Pseudomonadota bacterium]